MRPRAASFPNRANGREVLRFTPMPVYGEPGLPLPPPPGADDGWTIGEPAPPPEPAPVLSVERRRRLRRIAREGVETLLLALIVFLAVRATVQNFRVEGLSMYPTLENGQHIFVSKLDYAEINTERLAGLVPAWSVDEGARQEVLGGPARGDIIVFHGRDPAGDDLIKRVIALPGERIAIVNGRVFIDGQPLAEPYVVEPWYDTRPEITVPARHYYVMGDNRNSSQDSRSEVVGLVPRERIVGRALLRYWPLGDFGLAPNGGSELAAADLPPEPEADP